MDSTLNTELRALSWKEPFASLMLHDKIETRTWYAKYRGLVLICASLKEYSPNEVHEISGQHQYSMIRNALTNEGEAQMLKNRGYAIAVGELVDCRPMVKRDEDKCFVAFNSELWCHVYENVRAIELLPWKGSQGWRTVDDEFKDRIVFV